MASPMFDMGSFGVGIPANVASAFGQEMDGDEFVRCQCCGFSGVDIRVTGCGCCVHSRCCPLNSNGALTACPICAKPTEGLVLFPMSFREIDEAHKAALTLPASSKNRGRKRKGASGGAAGPESIEEKGSYVSERRTGRWSTEEMAYCDRLMLKFSTGEIPVADAVKMNEFLGNMLKSKQSRLTKKMKNAKLSSKTFNRGSGHLTLNEAREFSALEESFFQSIGDAQEKAEIRFHMQKEWREQFSRVCAEIGQPLDADDWLSSVEEMDRRASQARDAARMAKRKLMMGVALRTDGRNPERGVFIEKTASETRVTESAMDPQVKDVEEEVLSMLADDKTIPQAVDVNGKSSLLHSAPFLAKTTAYLQRHGCPFEHIDLWVPSFVPGAEAEETTCRLCYAGSATVDKMISEDGKSSRDLTPEEQFNFFAFGDYSQKFSFDVGCGLPGRVYDSGRPTWEQSVHNAPLQHFERCGGALQWNIQSVVGIPIASPNVGRIVVTLYSRYDRAKDEELVQRLSEEFTRLMPSPKWKLVVDVGFDEESSSAVSATGIPAEGTADPIQASANAGFAVATAPQPTAVNTATAQAAADQNAASARATAAATAAVAYAAANLTAAAPGNTPATPSGIRDQRIDEVVSLLGEFMPSDPSSELTPYLSGFMSLRLLLLRPSRSPEEEELVRTMLDSFSSYGAGGRQRQDIAVMLARDFLYLSQQQSSIGTGQAANAPGPAPAASAGGGLSLFGLPSMSSNLQNSPALAPIPVHGNVDNLSIVSD